MLGLWVPLSLFTVMGGIVWLIVHFRHKTRADMQQTVRLALEKGTELGPELLQRLSGPKPDKNKDIRNGLIWLAIALGFVGFGIGVGFEEEEVVPIFLGIAAFPMFIGIAHLIMWRYGRESE